MKFTFNSKKIEWDPQQVLIAGYTAKDQKALKDHIEELKKIGVDAPKYIPMIYSVSPELLSTKNSISTVKNDGSGEAEVVFLNIDGRWYVGIGSDHTDRVLEAVSVQKSKQVTAKPISLELWDYNSVKDHWDQIEMRSWVIDENNEKLYQSGTLGAFLQPEDLFEIIKERGYSLENTAVFYGTLPIIDEKFVYSKGFKAELHDPKTERTLSLQYNVSILEDSEEEINNVKA